MSYEPDDTGIDGRIVQKAQQRISEGSLESSGVNYQLQQINRILSGKYRGEVFTSMPMQTREDKLRLYNATAAQGNVISEMAKGNPVECVHVILCHAEFTGEEGDIKTGAKLVLIDNAGNCKVVLSQTFVKAFCDIIAMFSPLPFDPPLLVSATETKMNGGRRYYLPKLHQ